MSECDHPAQKVRVDKRNGHFVERCECGAWRYFMYGISPWRLELPHDKTSEGRRETA